MEDKISIIVPCYNIEKYIERAVKSICAQTYENIEIILVDDGSTDRTSFILDNLKDLDNRIRIVHKKNEGVTKARLTGVEVSTGKWIGFVDGDDYIEPYMYQRLLKNAKKYNAQISHCGYQMVFPNRIDYYYNTGRLEQQDNITGMKDLLEGTFVEPGLCNKLYHRTMFHSLLYDNLMDVSIRNMEDLLMNYYLFKESSRAVYDDFCPYHYMLRKGSAATSSMNKNKIGDPLKVFKIIKEDLNDYCLINTVDKRIIDNLVATSTMSLRNQRELVELYRKEARRELRNMRGRVLKGRFSMKQKVVTIWVSVWPESYKMIHTIYAKITGVDKKYDIH